MPLERPPQENSKYQFKSDEEYIQSLLIYNNDDSAQPLIDAYQNETQANRKAAIVCFLADWQTSYPKYFLSEKQLKQLGINCSYEQELISVTLYILGAKLNPKNVQAFTRLADKIYPPHYHALKLTAEDFNNIGVVYPSDNSIQQAIALYVQAAQNGGSKAYLKLADILSRGDSTDTSFQACKFIIDNLIQKIKITKPDNQPNFLWATTCYMKAALLGSAEALTKLGGIVRCNPTSRLTEEEFRELNIPYPGEHLLNQSGAMVCKAAHMGDVSAFNELIFLIRIGYILQRNDLIGFGLDKLESSIKDIQLLTTALYFLNIVKTKYGYLDASKNFVTEFNELSSKQKKILIKFCIIPLLVKHEQDFSRLRDMFNFFRCREMKVLIVNVIRENHTFFAELADKLIINQNALGQIINYDRTTKEVLAPNNTSSSKEIIREFAAELFNKPKEKFDFWKSDKSVAADYSVTSATTSVRTEYYFQL